MARTRRIATVVAAALLLSTMATTLLDWQFKGIVKDVYASNKEGNRAWRVYITEAVHHEQPADMTGHSLVAG